MQKSYSRLREKRAEQGAGGSGKYDMSDTDQSKTEGSSAASTGSTEDLRWKLTAASKHHVWLTFSSFTSFEITIRSNKFAIVYIVL